MFVFEDGAIISLGDTARHYRRFVDKERSEVILTLKFARSLEQMLYYFFFKSWSMCKAFNAGSNLIFQIQDCCSLTLENV